MAFAATVNWEVRTTGIDSNGGGFDPTSGVPGTDFSQQDAAQIAFTDLVIDAATNTKCTSAAHPFGATHVGNIINITGGAGFTVQRVQIMSVSGVIATVDKSLGTLGSTGGTGNLGGGLLTLDKAAGAGALAVDGNTVWLKSGTYTLTTAIVLSSGGTLLGVTVQGYQTTHGDNTGTRPVITSATNSANLIDLNAKSFLTFNNVKFTHTAGTRGAAITPISGGTNGNGLYLQNCVFDGCLHAVWADNGTPWGMGQMRVDNCEVKNCTDDAFLIAGRNPTVAEFTFENNWIHDNSGAGIAITTAGSANAVMAINCTENFFYNNTGGQIDLRTDVSRSLYLENNTIYKGVADGVKTANSTTILTLYEENSIIYGNGGFGINCTAAPLILANRNNAYGSNTSGNRNNLSVGTNDVALSADPLTSSTNPTLNSTVGGGASCKGTGFPGAFITGQSGFRSIGCMQESSTGGPVARVIQVQNSMAI